MLNVELKPLFARLNGLCTQCLEEAAGLCVSMGAYEVDVEHLLLKLVERDESDLERIFTHYGVDAGRVIRGLHRCIEADASGQGGRPVFSPGLIEWIQDAWLISSVELGESQIRSGALFSALLANGRRYARSEYSEHWRSVKQEQLREELGAITAGSAESDSALDAADAQPGRAAGSALQRFTIDFTGRARAGEIDPVFCRDREIRQIVDILGRRRKNNPIAVGDAGVGKTAIIEGLALKIAEGDVPSSLKDVEIFGLDMGLLQAGASVKGEFENRLKSVIEEVQASQRPIILFIDEAHTLIGAGGAAGGSDAANLLKPALARGQLRTIAATTWSEYKKYFEKDPALARRFQLVKLDEPSAEQATVILRGLRSAYEKAHGVYIRDDGVEAAARLSARYITGRQLPDKAIDVLDTACARVKVAMEATPRALEQLQRESAVLVRERDAKRRDQSAGHAFDDSADQALGARLQEIEAEQDILKTRWQRERGWVDAILDQRKILLDEQADEAAQSAAREQLERLHNDLTLAQDGDPLVHFEVGPEEIGAVVADWTGIPLGRMLRDEARAVLELGSALSRRIRGQDAAIDIIQQGIRASKAGLGNPHAPMGVFLLAGPSGVGKTETALAVADLLFGGERAMTTINMSEFQEKHTVSRLIGSPPGYVGFGEGGVLTEAVRQRPYSVVLLDEVEKADPEVLNLFYQVFDKGELADGEGRSVDFRNTVLFLTSNLAASEIMHLAAPGSSLAVPEIAEHIRPILAAHFKPALLARMTVVPYLPIGGEIMKEIVELKLGQLGERLRTRHGVEMCCGEDFAAALAAQCTQADTGARNVDAVIARTILPKASAELLATLGQDDRPRFMHLSMDRSGDVTCRFETEQAGDVRQTA